MQNSADQCSNCNTEAKCRRRDFSEQAWTVLLLWNEVQATAVDQPICDDCYGDLRETLIDRAEEIDAALSDTTNVGKPSHVPTKPTAPTTPRPKVRKAG